MKFFFSGTWLCEFSHSSHYGIYNLNREPIFSRRNIRGPDWGPDGILEGDPEGVQNGVQMGGPDGSKGGPEGVKKGVQMEGFTLCTHPISFTP